MPGNKLISQTNKIWQFTVISDSALIGERNNICSHCFLESGSKIENDNTIKNGVFIWNGIEIGNNVFVGPNVTFCNDSYPVNKNLDITPEQTLVHDDVVIGAGAIIFPGITLGKGCVIAAGTLVTNDVPQRVMASGNPMMLRTISGKYNDYKNSIGN